MKFQKDDNLIYEKKDKSANGKLVFLSYHKQLGQMGKWIGFHALFSIFFILVLEILARHSVVNGITFVWDHPFLICYSALILTTVYCLPLLFARRLFAWLMITVAILTIGIVNCILLFFRITPLAATDFSLITSVFSIMDIYLSTWQILLVGILAVIVLTVIMLVGIRMPKQEAKRGMGLMAVACLSSIILFVTHIGDETGRLCTSFSNLPDAYRENGFVYCFSRSLVGRGIDKPDEYSVETVDDILKVIKSTKTNQTVQRPNIIFLQLESFIDLRRFKNVTYSQQPQPVFASLREQYPGGFLTVPSVGAGTANTEFEVISGMDLTYFGVGEYPYKTVLQEKTCESIAYNLAENNYHSTAIHNNTGDFYDRNLVFANLGFDNFISEEYMKNVVYNEMGWAKDSVLTQNILDALGASSEKDFIYTISVQDHGKYSTQPIENPHIQTQGFDSENEERENAFCYYVNQCHETDAFLGYLITALEAYDEPIVLVLFGDHLPNLEVTKEQLLVGDLFQTEYVIWTNSEMNRKQPMEKKTKNLYAYQLCAYVQQLLGMNNGVITKFHQKFMDSESYDEELKMLQYDMLYGEQEMYGGKTGHETKDMKMGVFRIRIEKVLSVGGSIYVQGEHFTPYSTVYCNGKRLDTQFLNEKMLMVSDNEAKSGDYFTVAQTTEVYEKLSESEGYEYRE